MENYKEEINRLQTQLDELKSKIEKPKFEVGNWYKLIYDSKIVCYYKGNCDGYGIDSGYDWSNSLLMSDISLWTLASHSEVQEALTKEAIKRGFKEGVKFKTLDTNDIFTFKKIWFSEKILNTAWSSNCGIIYHNGKWATPIKSKTIEDLASQLIGLDLEDLTSELIKNKSEIIEILKNL